MSSEGLLDKEVVSFPGLKIGLDEKQEPFDPRTNQHVDAKWQWGLTIGGWVVLLVALVLMLTDWIIRTVHGDENGLLADDDWTYWTVFYFMPCAVYALSVPVQVGIVGWLPHWHTFLVLGAHMFLVFFMGQSGKLVPYLCGMAVGPVLHFVFTYVDEAGLFHVPVPTVKSTVFGGPAKVDFLLGAPMLMGLVNVFFSLFGRFKFWILLLMIAKVVPDMIKCYTLAKDATLEASRLDPSRTYKFNNPQCIRMDSVRVFLFVFCFMCISWTAENLHYQSYGLGFEGRFAEM